MKKHSESFTELVLWQKARSFRNIIYELCKTFPKEEKYRLSDQLIRSSRSITANIAEGHGRYHFQENIQFCRVARGSITESIDHLICALDCKFISTEEFVEFENLGIEIKKMINGYIKYLLRSKKVN
ncbi:MAG: four helix bundle protein [Saprospiraceae bacterium]|nr:four helix bundle protein [Bacteroidia bacterium]MBT8228708.1 four helix bundle protein [Bacteroidia bacterium]NNF21803.1 four helix bundle protein [Saprospiraceae bacterium]NNK89835.1 four helix bundle protein [Saprospiraceae bacterium]